MSLKGAEAIQHLTHYNCFLHRHGSKQDIYQNRLTKKKNTLPRHPKLDKFLCDLICKQLEIPK